jgi:hypothetical protein
MTPLIDPVAVDWPAYLLGAGRVHLTLSVVKLNAGALKTQPAKFQDPSDVAFQVIHELLMLNPQDFARQHRVPMPVIRNYSIRETEGQLLTEGGGFHGMMSCLLRIVAGVASLICDGLRWLGLTLRSSLAVEAENLFLRRQLALYVERGVTPRRIDSVTRIALTVLSGFFDWRDALVVVRPETLLRWHRQGWKLFWRLKSRPGRPPIPSRLQALIRQMARENPSWGQERIANELKLKLGIEVSPRTVRNTSY